MAKYKNLSAMFKDIADAIREVEGTEDSIPAGHFAARIRELSATAGVIPYGKMIGYYKFDRGSQPDTDREWLLNSATGGFSDGQYAQKLTSQIEFNSNETFEFEIDQESDVTTGWPANHHNLHMTSNGMDISYAGNEDGGYAITGVILDAIPSGRNFTVSFTLNMASGAGDKSNIAELFYIGPLSGSVDDGQYCRAFRENDSSSTRLKICQSNSRENMVSNLNNVFLDTGSKAIITLVFRNGMLTSYLNGMVGLQEGDNLGVNDGVDVNLPASDIRIIIDGIADNYAGRTLYIDDLYVFDCAFNDAQVRAFVTSAQTLELKQPLEVVVEKDGDTLNEIS